MTWLNELEPGDLVTFPEDDRPFIFIKLCKLMVGSMCTFIGSAGEEYRYHDPSPDALRYRVTLLQRASEAMG